MKFCKKIRIIVKTDFFPRHLITINRAVSRWSNKVWISSMDIKYGYQVWISSMDIQKEKKNELRRNFKVSTLYVQIKRSGLIKGFQFQSFQLWKIKVITEV